MDLDILLWLVEQFGWRVDRDIEPFSLVYVPNFPQYDLLELSDELYEDSPEGAWLREYIIKWIGREHSIAFGYSDYEDVWNIYSKHAKPIGRGPYPQAIIAAVEWLYEHREV